MDVSHKKRFLVRLNGEYSVIVEAKDESDALQQAEAIPLEEWQASWSEYEAEQESQVCDECRSFGPQSTCDCQR